MHGITSEYHSLLQKRGVEYYNLEEEKNSVYQIAGGLVTEDQMEQHHPFYAELFERLKQEFLNSNETQNSLSVKEWVDK